MVTLAFAGDSRARNLYEYFDSMLEGTFAPWKTKPHNSINRMDPKYNLKIDFIWGPQLETGDQ